MAAKTVEESAGEDEAGRFFERRLRANEKLGFKDRNQAGQQAAKR